MTNAGTRKTILLYPKAEWTWLYVEVLAHIAQRETQALYLLPLQRVFVVKPLILPS